MDDILFAKYDASGQLLFVKRFGGPMDEVPGAISADAKGAAFCATFTDSIDFGGGAIVAQGATRNLACAAFDASGKLVFARGFPGSSALITVRSVRVDPAGMLVAGSLLQGSLDFGGGPFTATTQVGFVASLDRDNGSFGWNDVIVAGNGLDAAVNGLALAGPSSALVCGTFTGPIDLGGKTLMPTGNPTSFYATLAR
jgi:hypothetical protein